MKVLKFGAKWCLGCMTMKPRWEKIEKETPWLKTEFYDFDEDKRMVKKHKIDKSLPVFVFLDKKGHEIERLRGTVSREKILEKINEYRKK